MIQYHFDSEDDYRSAQVVEKSVTVTNSSFQNYIHQDDQTIEKLL